MRSHTLPRTALLLCVWLALKLALPRALARHAHTDAALGVLFLTAHKPVECRSWLYAN